jgi:hypothetical protein
LVLLRPTATRLKPTPSAMCLRGRDKPTSVPWKGQSYASNSRCKTRNSTPSNSGISTTLLEDKLERRYTARRTPQQGTATMDIEQLEKRHGHPICGLVCGTWGLLFSSWLRSQILLNVSGICFCLLVAAAPSKEMGILTLGFSFS